MLRNLTGSPPYFEKCKKDLFALIRHLGNPIWFCSFSAAETRWVHLLKTLGRLVEKKDYTDDEIKNNYDMAIKVRPYSERPCYMC